MKGIEVGFKGGRKITKIRAKNVGLAYGTNRISDVEDVVNTVRKKKIKESMM